MSAAAVSPFDARRGAKAPDRTVEQRREGLRLANAIRTARAQFKQDLKAGDQRVQDALLEPPDFLLSCRVFDLLLAVPGYGRVRVNKMLWHSRISANKTVAGLSPRQREELVRLLPRKGQR